MPRMQTYEMKKAEGKTPFIALMKIQLTYRRPA
jgi:hypothetical protein